MITSEERRAIVKKIDAIDWDAAEVSWHFIGYLCRAMGMDSMDTYKDDVRIIAGKVRELCEANGLDAMSDEDLSSHGLMRLPKGADGMTVMPGQDVYGGDGRCWRVVGVGIGKYPIIAVPHGTRTDEGEYKRLKPSWLRHRRDTPRLLADEIDRWADSERDVTLEELRGIARRLRALGGGE